jgi:hypothetical protein
VSTINTDDAVTWSVVQPTAVGNPATINPTTGAFLWKPALADGLNQTFTIKATDSKGAIASYSLGLMIQPDNKPNFRVQQITEQVQGIRFHDEANLRAGINRQRRLHSDRDRCADPDRWRLHQPVRD